jgi:uncharacterized protein (DUF433 family)
MARTSTAHRDPPEDWHNHIVIDAKILAGKPVIKGSRVSVAVIVSALADGASVDEICRSYEIHERDVRAALAFAAESVEGERIVTLSRR